MTYELALQLKEAGFPQKYKECGDCGWDLLGIIWDKECRYHVYEPTLEELIEACGKIDFHIRYQDDGRIYAEFEMDDGHGNNIDFCLSSLEEIFANLYITLNKK